MRIQVDGAKTVSERIVDTVIIEHGTIPVAEQFDELLPRSVNLGQIDVPNLLRLQPQPQPNPDGAFELYRVGDAVASRNIQAAILDSYRLCCAI